MWVVARGEWVARWMIYFISARGCLWEIEFDVQGVLFECKTNLVFGLAWNTGEGGQVQLMILKGRIWKKGSCIYESSAVEAELDK